jgi:hypothetical protein
MERASTLVRIEWLSKDEQGCIDMGEWDSQLSVIETLKEAVDELASQCGSEDEIEGLQQGRMVVTEQDGGVSRYDIPSDWVTHRG